ncbi:MAG: BON domain-containing protein [Terriglobales bacterium]
MHLKQLCRLSLLIAASLSAGTLLNAQQSMGGNASADNTTVNQRDRGEPTADQQKNTRSDRDLTQQIRRAIVNDKSLSVYAHNVKIITQNGQVTLRGPVRSAEEKRAIEARASEIAGADRVTSEIHIKPKS